MPLRAPRDEFYWMVFELWQRRQYGELARYLFHLPLWNPYPSNVEGTVLGGGEGIVNAAPYQVLWADSDKKARGDPGLTYDPATDLLTIAGGIRYSAATWQVLANTADGADTNRFMIGAGGATSVGRGAYIQGFGNEGLANYRGSLGLVAAQGGEGGTYSDYVWVSTAAGKGLIPSADSNSVLGSPSFYWSNTYTDRIYVNATAYIDGATAGVLGAFGNLALVAANRVYWDGMTGAGDTYTLQWSANYLVDVVGGTATFGRIAGNIGIPATGQLFLDGVTALGHTSIRESADNIVTLKVNAVDSLALSTAAAYAVTDGLLTLGKTDVGFSALHLQDQAGAPTAEGEVRVNDTDSALEHLINATVHYNGPNLYCAAAADVQSGSGNLAETAFAQTFTIPAAYWTANKGIVIYAAVSGTIANPAGENITLRVHIGTGAVAARRIVAEIGISTTAAAETVDNTFVIRLVPRSRAAAATVVFSGEAKTARNAPAGLPIAASVSLNNLYLTGSPNTFTLDTTAAQTIVVTLTVGNSSGQAWSFNLDYLDVDTMH